MPDYELYEGSGIWHFRWIVEMLVPGSVSKEDNDWERLRRPRLLVESWLCSAIKAGKIKPINNDWLKENITARQDMTEREIYHGAEILREDCISWIESEGILDLLEKKGVSPSKQLLEMFGRIKKKSVSKINTNERRNDVKDFIPAPEGTKWKNVKIIISYSEKIKIIIGDKSRRFSIDEFKELFPNKKPRDLLIELINQGGSLCKNDFLGLSQVADHQHQKLKDVFRSNLLRLRNELKNLFKIPNNPIIYRKKTSVLDDQYETQFKVSLKVEPSEDEDDVTPEDNPAAKGVKPFQNPYS